MYSWRVADLIQICKLPAVAAANPFKNTPPVPALIVKEVAPVVLPRVIVFALAFDAILTLPVDPESSVTLPVVPVVSERFPVVPVSTEIPPVPDRRLSVVAPVVFPTATVLALALVPTLTFPVVPESRVTAPVVPVVSDRLPVVEVSKVIPPVPEVRFTAVAPVAFPIATVLALALVPMLTLPVVPESSVNAPVVPVNTEIPPVPEVSEREVAAVVLPIVIVFSLALVPMLTPPVVPESKVTEPVVPELSDKLPDVVVSSAMPPVPEVRLTAVAPVAFPMAIVLALALVPMLTLPVVPESSVTVPVVPELSDKFPDVVVSSAIPPVPDVKFTAVAPVALPMAIVLALALVPMLTLPVVPESSVTVPVVPELSDKLPDVEVSSEIPPVPDVRLTAVAPVLLPIAIV